MSLFSAIDISGTGVDAMQTWIDASAGNIANANDETSTNNAAYADQVVNFAPVETDGTGEGVSVDVTASDTEGEIVPDPDNPEANSQGEVRSAGVDLGDQLVNLMTAQEDYGANTQAISKATAAYQAALTIGN